MTDRRYLRLSILMVVLVALSGCATGPVESPPRLDDTAFANWINGVNRVAAEAAAAGIDKPPLERISQVFDTVATAVQDQPGEASWIITKWRKDSGKVTTLFDYFLTRNHLLNYYFVRHGSRLLMPLKPDRYGLTIAKESLDAMFGPGEIYIAPWIVDDPEFVFGTSYGAVPLVNRARVAELHDWIKEHASANSGFSRSVRLGPVMQVVAANEVAHATLVQRFGFHVSSAFDRQPIADRIPGLLVSDARQVHEFISDAASVNTHRVAIFALTANMLRALNSKDGATQSDGPYTPSARFFMDSVQQILNRRGRSLNIADAMRSIDAREPELKRYASGQLAMQILEAMGEAGYQDLRNDYRRYGQLLIDHISKTQG